MNNVINSCLDFGMGTVCMEGEIFGDYKAMFMAMGSFIILMLLLCLFGKYLWNTILVVLVPAIKPATSVFQILGMFLLTGLMFGN